MSGKKIGLILALDGEREFTAAVQAAKKEVGLFETQLGDLSEEFDNNANSMDYLRKKQDLLSQQQAAYKRQLEAAQAGQKKANDNYREQGKRLGELEKQLEEARQAQEQMEASGQKGTRQYEKQAKTVSELEKAVEKQRIAKAKEIGSISDWNKKVYEANRASEKLNNEIGRNSQYLKEAEQAADHCATSIDKMGQEVKQASGEMEELGDSADGVAKVTTTMADKVASALVGKGVSEGLDLLKQGAEAVKESMYDLSGASSRLAASTGLSESAMKKYRAVMKQIKGDNFGEDYSDISSVMAEVVQIMGELDSAGMTEVTESAIALRDTFNMDINESIRAADVMMKTMGVDAAAAFDLIAKGAQNGLNRSGELTDNITEYAQIWGQAGFSAEQMFAILENGLDAGAYNLDKVNDYVKEFGNSLADGRIGKNIGYFSEGTKNLFDEWKNGNASTSDVFYSVINDLSEMTNQQKALTIASEVWSALGEDNAMQVITALDDVNNAYKNVHGTMDSLKEVRYSDLESAVSGLGSAIQENLVTPIADAALPTITGLFETATEVVNGIGEAIAPQKTAMDEFMESIEQANEGLETSIRNADETMQNAELEASKISTLGAQLMALNGVEDKSLAQKYQLKEIVSQLGQSIPEIAAAYDEEAGKVQLTDSAIQSLIGSTKDLMIAQAAQNAMQGVANKLIEAEIALENAKTAQAVASDKKAMYEEEKQLLQELQNEYDQYEQALAGAADGDAVARIEANYTNAAEVERRYLEFWNEQLASGRATIEEYNAALENVGIGQLGNRLVKNENDVAEWDNTLSEASGDVEVLQENVKLANEEVDIYSETVQKATDRLNGENDALRENAGLSDADIQRLEQMERKRLDSADAARTNADAIEIETDALDANAEAAKAGAEAQKEAAQGIRDAYESARSEIESSLQNKISLTDMFDGGEDVTTEQMNQNLQSFLDGITNYQENLAKVKAMTDENGKALFSPDVMAAIAAGGTEYANMLSHLVYTWENQGEYGYEQLKGISTKWAEALDMTESMAEVQAANRVAYEMAMGELGSSDADFSAVRKSVAGAVTGPLKEELDSAVDAAQECGIKIPEGLAEGIASGEVSPEAAIAQLNGTLQGSFDALSEMAKKAGIGDDVLAELAAGIEAGGQEAVAAYSELVRLIAGKSPELQKALEEGVQTEGMAASIESDAGSVADAVAGQEDSFRQAGKTLGEAVIGGLKEALEADDDALILNPDSISSKADEYTEAGRTLGEAVVAGLKEKEDDINNALSPNLEGMDTGTATAAGTALGEAVAAAVGGTAQNAVNAGSLLGQSAANGALRELEQIRQAGQESAQAYLNAVNAAQQQAEQAGGALASGACSAVAAYENAFYSAGYNMAAGVASGIYAGTSGAVNAAADMAAKTLAAAKAALEIHSPSKKFRKEVGQNISESTAFGIRDRESLAGKAAKRMSAKVYTNATSWLAKYKKSQQISIADEKWYWQQVLKHTKSGTAAYNSILKKIQNTDILQLAAAGVSGAAANKIVNNFGVSKTAKNGKKTKKKDTETYYSEIYSAAQKYLSNQKVLNDWSLQQELAYWDAVKGQLKSGTQAWYDATKQVNSLNDEIAAAAQERIRTQASVQKDILDKYKIYNSVSAKAEMQYWDIARKQFAAGTDERTEADEKYLEAKEEYYDELKELDEKYLEDQKDINEKLEDSIKDLQDAYDDAVKSRKKDILSSMDLFESWDAGGYTKDVLTANLKTQVEGLEFWEKQLEELGKKKISRELLDELKDMGPEAAANLWSLNQMTEKELEEYNRLWAEKNELAHRQAVEDNEALLKETNDAVSAARKTAKEEMDALQKDYRAAVAKLNTGLSDGLKSLVTQAGKIGEEIVSKLVNAIKDATPSTMQKAVSDASAIINSSANPLYTPPAAAPAKTAAATDEGAGQEKRILAIINSGAARKKTLTEREKKDHVALWQYIATKYGRTATNSMYARLGDELGVETSGTPTGAQKTAILKKLKEKGFSGGTKRIMEDDEYWVHPGEMLVRRSDSGMLRTLNAGDGVIPARLTENLMEWGQESPAAFLDRVQAAMVREQEELAAHAVKPDYSGIAKLNRLMKNRGPQKMDVNVDNGELASLLGTLIKAVSGLSEKLDRQQIVMDTGALVGAIQPAMSRENAAVEIRRNRGRL